MRKLAVALAVLAVSVAPLAGGVAHADAVGTECYGVVADGGTASCTATFPLSDARYVSDVSTHANYHTLAARGSLTLTWLDRENRVIATYNCAGLGLPGDGEADKASANCTRNGAKADGYVIGLQKLVITTTNTTCGLGTSCTFHGRIRLSQPSDAY